MVLVWITRDQLTAPPPVLQGIGHRPSASRLEKPDGQTPQRQKTSRSVHGRTSAAIRAEGSQHERPGQSAARPAWL